MSHQRDETGDVLASPSVLERANRAFTGMQEGVWDWDLVTNDCYISDKWWSNLGFQKGEFVSSLANAFALIHPDDLALVTEVNERSKAPDAPPYEVEFRLRTHDGSYRWTLARGHVQRDASGKALRIIGVNTDTTEERRMRAELERSKEFSDKLINASVDGIFAFDKLCRLTAYNPAMEQMWGYTRAEVLGQNAFELFPFLRHSHEDCLFYDALAGRSKVSRDRPYQHRRSGRTGTYEAQYVPLTHTNDKVIGGLVVVRETSVEKERAQLHQLLIEAGSALLQTINMPELLQNIVKLACRGLCDWCVVLNGTAAALPQDCEQRRHHIAGAHVDAPAHTELVSWLQEDAAKLGFFDGQSLPLIDGQATSEHVEQIPSGLVGLVGRDARIAHKLSRLGFSAYLRVPLVARQHHFGTLTMVNKTRQMDAYAVSTAELFAHRAALALDNAKLFIKTSEARRMRERVLAAVSRELAHPLDDIERSCVAAQTTQPPAVPATREMAAHVHRYVERMKNFIGSILDAANLEGGRFAIEPGPIDIPQLIAELVETMRPVAEDRHIHLMIDPGSVTPTAWPQLRGDRARLDQVLTNLIDNAIKFSPKDGTVSIAAQRAKDVLELQVRDEGPGIAAEQQHRLFERLWQKPGDRHQGSGLGLYIAHGIIRAHGGSIQVHSRSPQQPIGTRFVVSLPLEPSRE